MLLCICVLHLLSDMYMGQNKVHLSVDIALCARFHLIILPRLFPLPIHIKLPICGWKENINVHKLQKNVV